MPDDLALDVLGSGVGTHIDAADILAHDAQHNQDHTAQQQQQRRGGRPADRCARAGEVADDDLDEVQKARRSEQRAKIGRDAQRFDRKRRKAVHPEVQQLAEGIA